MNEKTGQLLIKCSMCYKIGNVEEGVLCFPRFMLMYNRHRDKYSYCVLCIDGNDSNDNKRKLTMILSGLCYMSDQVIIERRYFNNEE